MRDVCQHDSLLGIPESLGYKSASTSRIVYMETEFQELLRRYRKGAELTQRGLGEACGWGKDAQSRVANYENGYREPNLTDIRTMASVLHVSPAELAFGSLNLTEDEAKLVQAWNQADSEMRETFRALVKAVIKVREAPTLAKARKVRPFDKVK